MYLILHAYLPVCCVCISHIHVCFSLHIMSNVCLFLHLMSICVLVFAYHMFTCMSAGVCNCVYTSMFVFAHHMCTCMLVFAYHVFTCVLMVLCRMSTCMLVKESCVLAA